MFQFRYLIAIKPLGLMYGSAGGFLSPENLVGRSGAKFPPDAYTLSGLFFNVNKSMNFGDREDLKYNLYVAGPFWANTEDLKDYQDFYIPIPWTKIINQDKSDEWRIKDDKWYIKEDEEKIEAEYSWQIVNYWEDKAETIRKNEWAASNPWQYVSVLHPKMKDDERHVQEKDGLFLEYAVQMPEENCLVYLSTHELPSNWYRFGGESHLVEIESIKMDEDHPIIELLQQPIQKTFALITPGVWGSKSLSLRYPKNPDFPEPKQMLTDKPIPYRHRAGNKLGRGRYAVPAGSVYVLEKPLNKTWWDWPEAWFPKQGYPLKHIGCGLSLPIEIEGVN